MRPYPWYEINGLTRELEPYALYSCRRVHFKGCYRPEPDQPLLDVEALRNSVTEDQDRYGWISGDPTMRDIVHMLWCNPDAFTKLSMINKEYMAGFRERHYIDQARIHMITACLLLGETYEDSAITKQLLRHKTLDLWGLSWLRSEGNFSPSATELEATIKKLPPMMAGNFHWETVFRDLGLLNLPEFGKQNYKPGPGIFSWMMRSDPKMMPEHGEDVASLLDASMRSVYSTALGRALEACS